MCHFLHLAIQRFQSPVPSTNPFSYYCGLTLKQRTAIGAQRTVHNDNVLKGNTNYLPAAKKRYVVLRPGLLTVMAEDIDCEAENEGGRDKQADSVDGDSSTSQHGRAGANARRLAPEKDKLMPQR